MAENTGIAGEVISVRRSLRELDRTLGRLASGLITAIGEISQDRGKTRPRLSPKARASMVLQGRYMGYMRQLKPRQKAQVRKIRETMGVTMAISKARQLSGV